MSNYEATKYDFSGASLTGIEGIPTGTIVPWSTASVPTGYLECNGQSVSRTTYAALYAIISTTYGSDDGSSFSVPDLQDNVAVGKSGTKNLASTGGANTVSVAASGNVSTNVSGNVTTNVSGNVGGSVANHTLTEAQLASHSHSGAAANWAKYVSTPDGTQAASANQGANTGSAGSGSAHGHNLSANLSATGSSNFSGSGSSTFSGATANPSTLQPYLAIMYIIKT